MIKTIPFIKYHGQGNDWLVVRERVVPSGVPEFARKILDRNTGAGADGLIIVRKAEAKGHDARIRFFNADGSEAEMSGNGARCAGAFLIESQPQKRRLEIETLAGLKVLESMKSRKGQLVFRVHMGAPILTTAEIPFRPAETPSPILRMPLTTHRGDLPITVTSMGNPHCSVFVADFDNVDWKRLGSEIEQNDHFPNRTNVEFVRLVSRDEIEVRFWERGVGHTKSSGTGSSAAAVAAILNGLTDRRVKVQTEAGPLEVVWPSDQEVTLIGPVMKVMQGKCFLSL